MCVRDTMRYTVFQKLPNAVRVDHTPSLVSTSKHGLWPVLGNVLKCFKRKDPFRVHQITSCHLASHCCTDCRCGLAAVESFGGLLLRRTCLRKTVRSGMRPQTVTTAMRAGDAGACTLLHTTPACLVRVIFRLENNLSRPLECHDVVGYGKGNTCTSLCVMLPYQNLF